MLFYRAALPLSSRTLDFAAGIIRRHRESIGSRWRMPSPGQQALLVLAYLRKAQLRQLVRFRFPLTGHGHGHARSGRTGESRGS